MPKKRFIEGQILYALKQIGHGTPARGIHVLLKREGWKINHERVYCLYCEGGLNPRAKRPRKRVAASPGVGRPEVAGINECRSMDFVSCTLHVGPRPGRGNSSRGISCPLRRIEQLHGLQKEVI